jgi:hypothetical protein
MGASAGSAGAGDPPAVRLVLSVVAIVIAIDRIALPCRLEHVKQAFGADVLYAHTLLVHRHNLQW